MAGITMPRFFQPTLIEDCATVFQHARATADHKAIMLRVNSWQANVAGEFANSHQISNTALVLEGFACHCWVVHQLFLSIVRRSTRYWAGFVRCFPDRPVHRYSDSRV